MGLPSGSFSSSDSGRLQISFSGTWTANGADYGSGAWSLLLRCVADNGTNRQTALIDIKATSAVIEIDYTAGQSVAVSMTEVDFAIVGAGSISASKLRISCQLIKR